MSTIKVKYSSNNSGGDWWLSDDDWENLERRVEALIEERDRYKTALAALQEETEQ